MKIMTAVDHSEYAEIVLEHALDRAARASAAELHFVTIIRFEYERQRAHEWLDAMVRDALDEFGQTGAAYELHVVRGLALPALAAVARRLAPDLLVIGRFHVPSLSDRIVEVVECPILVVDIDGVALEPQCPACRDVRRATGAERLFCADHAGDHVPDLVSRLPSSTNVAGRGIW